jgi:colanic acid/amylovoran biosynthesis glycosyltransferase
MKPRVAHVCPTFSALSETFIYDTLNELERQCVPSSVATFRRLLPGDRPFAEVRTPNSYMRAELRVRWIISRLRRDYPEALHHQTAIRARALDSLLRRAKPDLVHAHFGPMGVMAAPLARAMGLPLVTTFYGYDVSRLLRYPAWVDAYRVLWPQLSAAVVLSAEMRTAIQELGCPGAKIQVVHLARPTGIAFRPPRRRVETLVSVGRLVKKKGHINAIQALAEARQTHPHLRLRILGEGPDRKVIEATIGRLGLSSNVQLLGAQPRDAALEEMRRADAFVLCSRTGPDGDREGTPTTIIEAAATGLPCVSTTHAGIPEIIAPENQWLLAEEGDVSGLAARLTRLAACETHELEEIARAGWRHIDDAFDLSTETGKLIAIYHRALASGGSP